MPPTPSMLTPAAVRGIRKRLGLTLREFADLLHVHWNTVAKWERGDIGMRPSTAALIRRVGDERIERRGKRRSR
jgi:DNA-binding transcriptional regulator YiaG